MDTQPGQASRKIRGAIQPLPSGHLPALPGHQVTDERDSQLRTGGSRRGPETGPFRTGGKDLIRWLEPPNKVSAAGKHHSTSPSLLFSLGYGRGPSLQMREAPRHSCKPHWACLGARGFWVNIPEQESCSRSCPQRSGKIQLVRRRQPGTGASSVSLTAASPVPGT